VLFGRDLICDRFLFTAECNAPLLLKRTTATILSLLINTKRRVDNAGACSSAAATGQRTCDTGSSTHMQQRQALLPIPALAPRQMQPIANLHTPSSSMQLQQLPRSNSSRSCSSSFNMTKHGFGAVRSPFHS
jgi:hypothetical protein